MTTLLTLLMHHKAVHYTHYVTSTPPLKIRVDPHSFSATLTPGTTDDGNLIRFPEVDEQKYVLARQLLSEGLLPSSPPSSTPGVMDTVRNLWDRFMSS